MSLPSATPLHDGQPSVLLLGGLGMVGINILKYLVDFELASYIRVVDKRVPAICDLAPMFTDALASPEVEFMQADVSIPHHVERAFALPTHPRSRRRSTGGEQRAIAQEDDRPSPAPSCFTVIINAAAESSYGYFDSVYKQNILELRQRCAAAATAACVAGSGGSGGCECYIEISTAEVYDCGDSGNSKPATEADGVVAPWTILGRYHAEAEAYLQGPACAALPWIIARLPTVYGPADKRGLMPRLACAAIYARTAQKMELLWGSGLRVSTVHAQDAASAIWHLACTGKVREVYNICDDGDTSHGTLCTIMGEIFGIRTGFHSSITSKIASTCLAQLADEVNGDHMEVWNGMLREAGIAVTCVTPFLDPERLTNHSVRISNAKLKALGFQLSCPKVTRELLEDVMEYWTSMKLFPPKEVIFHVVS